MGKKRKTTPTRKKVKRRAESAVRGDSVRAGRPTGKSVPQTSASARAKWRRAGVATVLLEHLREQFPKRYERRIAQLAAKSVEFAGTVQLCW